MPASEFFDMVDDLAQEAQGWAEDLTDGRASIREAARFFRRLPRDLDILRQLHREEASYSRVRVSASFTSRLERAKQMAVRISRTLSGQMTRGDKENIYYDLQDIAELLGELTRSSGL